MKFKYIIPAFIAVVAAMFTGCSEDNDPSYLGEINVSQSYVGLPADGGSVSVSLAASDSWTVKNVPAWLTVSPESGSAGTTNLTFSAGKASSTNEATITIECGGQTQEINVIQMKGAEKNFLSLGIEVGDILTVEGPKTTYNGTVELVNVTVINIEKSLIKADSLMVDGVKGNVLPLEGGEFEARLTNKGKGISVDVPADAQAWLSVLGVQTSGNTSIVKFRAAANTGGDRKTTLVFKTTDGKKEYTTQAEVSQKGAIIEGPIADFLAAEVGDTQFRLTGVITELYASDKQGKSFYIADYSGQVLIYRAEGFIEAGAKVGDVVTVVGKRGAYKDTPQMVNGTFEALVHAVETVSLTEFLAKEPAADKFYKIGGTIDEIANDQYGNLYLTDGTERVYVYGCYPGWGATGDARKGLIGTLGLKVGDYLEVIGVRAVYKETPQLSNGIYFTHKSAN